VSRVLTTSIEVEATVERVWEIVTEISAYPDWNPFITSIEGELAPGSRLEVRIQPPGGRAMTVRPVVKGVQKNRELSWLGRLFVRGVFDGEHRFQVEPLAEGRTRFTQSETFRGLLVPLTAGVLRKTRRGFEEMNAALKNRAEAKS
jgi:hypothetical protein